MQRPGRRRAGHRVVRDQPSHVERLGGALNNRNNNHQESRQDAKLTLVVSACRSGRFVCRLSDAKTRLLPAACRAPVTHAARKLIRLGHPPETLILVFHVDAFEPCLQGRLGTFATLIIDESSTPRFKKYRALAWGGRIAQQEDHPSTGLLATNAQAPA
jgi:hypothetical protein